VDGYDFTQERLLHTLISALESHGLPGNVGLLDPAVFKQHVGGTGIIAVCNGQAPEVAALLEAMGVAVRPVPCGIEGHLRGELGPVPPLPLVEIRSADCCRAAESAAGPVPARKCTRCSTVKPAEEFPFWRKAKGYRGSFCYECDRERQRAMYHARKAAAGS
jgi:hypothetical protein